MDVWRSSVAHSPDTGAVEGSNPSTSIMEDREYAFVRDIGRIPCRIKQGSGNVSMYTNDGVCLIYNSGCKFPELECEECPEYISMAKERVLYVGSTGSGKSITMLELVEGLRENGMDDDIIEQVVKSSQRTIKSRNFEEIAKELGLD